MSNVLSVLAKTVILDDAAYRAWRDRPNPFLRGMALIVVISLVAGLATFGINLASKVKPVDTAQVEEGMRRGFQESLRWNLGWQAMDPKMRKMAEEQMDVIVEMVTDMVRIGTPLPRGVSGFFEALGAFLSRAPGALAGWLFYGALVLVAVNLLGGAARLPDFLGSVSLYVIPGLLGLLGWIPCLGPLLGLAAWIWGVVMYVKAVSVASDLDTGRSVLATFAPAVVILALGLALTTLWIVWLVIVF